MPGLLNTDVSQILANTLWVCVFCLLSYLAKELSNLLTLADHINNWPSYPPWRHHSPSKQGYTIAFHFS